MGKSDKDQSRLKSSAPEQTTFKMKIEYIQAGLSLSYCLAREIISENSL